MAGRMISELDSATSLQTGDLIPLARGATTLKIDGSSLTNSITSVAVSQIVSTPTLLGLQNYLPLTGGNLSGALNVTSGNVGIGTTTPYAKLTVMGDISATGDVVAFSTSDERLKNNISKISNALDKVFAIQGIEFQWNTELQTTHSGNDVGVIAQEVETVMPTIVVERDNGYKAVKYEKLIPLLIESIKDLKTQLDSLSAKSQTNCCCKK